MICCRGVNRVDQVFLTSLTRLDLGFDHTKSEARLFPAARNPPITATHLVFHDPYPFPT